MRHLANHWWNCQHLVDTSMFLQMITFTRIIIDLHHALVVRVRQNLHDDVIKWKQFPRCWPFVRGIQRSPVNSPHKGQWRGALMFSLICVWISGWVNNPDSGDLRRYGAHYDVSVMRKDNKVLKRRFASVGHNESKQGIRSRKTVVKTGIYQKLHTNILSHIVASLSWLVKRNPCIS